MTGAVRQQCTHDDARVETTISRTSLVSPDDGQPVYVVSISVVCSGCGTPFVFRDARTGADDEPYPTVVHHPSDATVCAAVTPPGGPPAPAPSGAPTPPARKPNETSGLFLVN